MVAIIFITQVKDNNYNKKKTDKTKEILFK